jgi:transcriptional regulator with XRE-family HTH domain
VKLPLQKRFGKKVAALRRSAEISQEDFADRCGVARSYMSRIECGKANPSMNVIEALAAALKVPVKKLFED